MISNKLPEYAGQIDLVSKDSLSQRNSKFFMENAPSESTPDEMDQYMHTQTYTLI